MITLEVCSNSLTSAIAAQKGGAARVELCDNLGEGGTTPSAATIVHARKALNIQLFVLIRPRGGDFLYSKDEFKIMESDIRFCAQTGCDGVVFGILNKDGSIDMERNSKLMELSKRLDLQTTFHRAFDRSRDLLASLDDVIELGFDRVLTSGGYPTALLGADVIRQLMDRSKGQISIIPGAGITADNVHELVKLTNLKEFHGSFRSRYYSEMTFRNTTINDPESETELWITDEGEVRKAICNANK